MIRKVFLEELPKIKGRGKSSGQTINNWMGSVGYSFKFIYDGIDGVIEIVGYNKKSHELDVKYLNKYFKINTSLVINAQLGVVIGISRIYFKYNIGDIVNTDFGEIQIINSYRHSDNNAKRYEYRCLNCSNIDNMTESELISGTGCNVCCPTPRKILIGYNDIGTTNPWMVESMIDKTNATKYTYGSNQRILFKCLECGEPKLMKICDFFSRGICCNKCGDGVSFPNKIGYNVLSQVKIDFDIEKMFEWCVYIDPKKNKQCKGRYDFYFKFKNKEYIVEMDGEFHTKDNGMSGQKAEDAKYIDDMKDELAEKNNIKVIRIDCCPSSFEHIKESILNSELNTIFDLSNIDWNECNKYALSTKVREVCDLWNSGIKNVTELYALVKSSKPTIATYLTRGATLGWCDYNGQEELTKRTIRNNKKNLSKQLKCIETGKIFESTCECARVSEEVFGMKLFQPNISAVCRKVLPSYKGLHFEYI